MKTISNRISRAKKNAERKREAYIASTHKVSWSKRRFSHDEWVAYRKDMYSFGAPHKSQSYLDGWYA